MQWQRKADGSRERGWVGIHDGQVFWEGACHPHTGEGAIPNTGSAADRGTTSVVVTGVTDLHGRDGTGREFRRREKKRRVHIYCKSIVQPQLTLSGRTVAFLHTLTLHSVILCGGLRWRLTQLVRRRIRLRFRSNPQLCRGIDIQDPTTINRKGGT